MLVQGDIVVLLLRLGFVAAIYFFLLQLLVVLWRDVAAPAPLVAPAPVQTGLEVLDGGASARATGEVLPLEAITSIGRAEQNTIVLADPSVSAEHAVVSYRLGQWWVEDMASTNGTRVNDARIDQPTVLRTGDIVRLGMIRLRVRL